MAERETASTRDSAVSSAKSRSGVSGRYVSKNEARAAAKTKVTVDKRLGKKTPGWVTKLASES